MKKISYWNAIITHVLTTGFMTVVLNLILIYGLGYLINILPEASLGIVGYIVVPALLIGCMALATYLSARFMRRYEIDNVSNFINFSSIIAAVILILQNGLDLIGIAVALASAFVFFTISKKMLGKAPAAPIQTM